MVKKAPPYQAMSTDRSSLRQTRDDYFKTVEAQDLRKMRANNPASLIDSMDDSIRNSDHANSIQMDQGSIEHRSKFPFGIKSHSVVPDG